MIRNEDYCNHPADVSPEPCPCCGDPATSWSENAGWDLLGNNEYHAFAGCPACGVGFHEYWTDDSLRSAEDDDMEGCVELERRAINKWNRRHEEAPTVNYGVLSCPFCGSGRAYGKHEDIGEIRGAILKRDGGAYYHCGRWHDLHEDIDESTGVGTDWQACAACPDCDAGIDLYVEESTDPDAGEALEREAVSRWNRRAK